MKQTYFPVERSILSAEALIQQVLSKYALSDPVHCQLFQRGINDIYVVEAGQSRYYLRVAPSKRWDLSQLQAEVMFTNALAEGGVPVARPVAQADGAYVHELTAPEGERYAILFEDVGVNVDTQGDDGLSADQHEQVGRALAQTHLLAMQQGESLGRYHIDTTQWIDEPLRLAEQTFPQHSDQLESMGTIGESLRKAIVALPQSPTTYGLCHGDFHHGNLLVNEEGQVAIIDFDECGYSWYVYDIATYIWSHLFPEMVDPEEAIRTAFLKGYQEVRPLNAMELEALPLFIALRHFWVGGLAVRQAQIDGMSAISEQLFAYFVYFLEQVGK